MTIFASNRFRTVTVGLVATLSVACSASGQDNGNEIPVDKAKDLLAAEVGDGADIETKVAEKVTWPNGALGCPKAGRNYTQALVQGYRIVLMAEGREYAYHGRQGGEPFYCSTPENPSQWRRDR